MKTCKVDSGQVRTRGIPDVVFFAADMQLQMRDRALEITQAYLEMSICIPGYRFKQFEVQAPRY